MKERRKKLYYELVSLCNIKGNKGGESISKAAEILFLDTMEREFKDVYDKFIKKCNFTCYRSTIGILSRFVLKVDWINKTRYTEKELFILFMSELIDIIRDNIDNLDNLIHVFHNRFKTQRIIYFKGVIMENPLCLPAIIKRESDIEILTKKLKLKVHHI